MSVALIVILVVLVSESARDEPSAEAVGVVLVVAALLLIRGWLLLVWRRATRRAATRSRASTTSPIFTTSFVGSPRRQGSTGSRLRSYSCTCRGGTRTKRSAGSSGLRASSTSSHGSTTAGSQSFW